VCDGRSINPPIAARTIASIRTKSSVPRAFARSNLKINECRTDNQPRAVRAFDGIDNPPCCPEHSGLSESEKNFANPARTQPNESTNWRPISGACRVGLNNIATGKWLGG
jgi:hypothetical protein